MRYILPACLGLMYCQLLHAQAPSGLITEVPYFPPGWPQNVHLAFFIQPISDIPGQLIHCFWCNTITPYGLFDGLTCVSYDQNGVCLGSATNGTSSNGGNIDPEFANAIYANFTAYSNVCQLMWMTVSYNESELGCGQTVNNVTHCVAFEKVLTNGEAANAVSDFQGTLLLALLVATLLLHV